MLAVSGATVQFNGKAALDGVDLSVREREVVAVLGPSGSGKSTLLRVIAGLEPLAQGTVSWNGTDISGLPTHRRGFALMFQDGQLFDHRSVAGNVAYALRVRHASRAEIGTRVEQMLEMVGLAGFGDRRPATLSGGERQRVALARSLAVRPRLLLLDEPLSALDRALRERLAADLRGLLTTTGTPAILVTHDEAEADVIADRVVQMDHGRLGPSG
jgi:thiamine transport system ATP-binding protein